MMSDEQKGVKAVIEGGDTTIHQKEGIIEERRKGVLKGFGKGLSDYIQRGSQVTTADIEVNVGQFPANHKKAGKWCVQIMVYAFDNKEAADTIADRLTPRLKKGLAP